MSFFTRTTSQRFQGKFVWKKHVTVQERMDKNFEIIVVEAVDAWKKRVYHLVHIHVRAPENGGITNGNTAEAGSGLRHSRLIRFCLRRNTGGETC